MTLTSRFLFRGLVGGNSEGSVVDMLFLSLRPDNGMLLCGREGVREGERVSFLQLSVATITRQKLGAGKKRKK